MQEQQHGLPVIVTSNGHPLLDSADPDKKGFLDTPGLRRDATAKDDGDRQKGNDLSHVNTTMY